MSDQAFPSSYQEMIPNNGSAFPVGETVASLGLTKREFLAGLAMQGMAGNQAIKDQSTIPALAVNMADAIMKILGAK